MSKNSNFGTKRNDLKWTRLNLKEDSLIGKKIAIIDGTNGLGRAIALEFISKGAEIIVVGRTFRDQGLQRLSFIQADLSEMNIVRSLAKELPVETLDILVMTHRIFLTNQRQTNSNGVEIDMAISSLSRYVLLQEIAGRLGKNRINSSTKPRVFIWGFPGGERKATLDDFNSEKNYSWSVAHSNGIVGNEALVLESAERFPSINFYGMNPGIIGSNIAPGLHGGKSVKLKILQLIMGILFENAKKYAKKITPLLVSPDIELYSGAMFGRQGDPILSNPVLLDKSYLKRVIEESEKLINRTN